jgi:type I restriction enzyme M protein
MPIRKSELYATLWASCDALRGGMDASQYKDYVLSLLFIKYVSDKYAGKPFQPITIPPGASFGDMVGFKGRKDIGDWINKHVVAPLVKENPQLALSDFPDFNSDSKLGTDKEKVDRLTRLIAIFENKALDFSKNRAGDDDILGDAYEYLMRHFAVDSGKSKGQFYTPAEVSRVMSHVLGIGEVKLPKSTTIYDPTCGSGSLLLKLADAAGSKVTIYGQEKDSTTAGLARMNMILHDHAEADIVQGNTLTDPRFREDRGALRTFHYVVANPPFSDKQWSTGLDPLNDAFDRFAAFGTPPAKQGDYAYLLHIVRSLKPNGRGACILPHGVLFRGNAEADIRRNLVRRGYIEAVIGLPANLFYGTGIPACIVIIDKAGAATRDGIFLVDASAGYLKDGPKNRLRERDIHKIVDVYRKRETLPGYARLATLAEIEKNDFNLNLPRYIDSLTRDDAQDIEGHLKGGIPAADIDALQDYWSVCPGLRAELFRGNRPGYWDLAVDITSIKTAIHANAQFRAFVTSQNAHFAHWREHAAVRLKALARGCAPKRVIAELSESLLEHYRGQPLLDPYAVYQHLMDDWAASMQDDVYLIAVDGWKAETYRIVEQKKNKDGHVVKEIDRGWTCDLVPKPLVVARWFAAEQARIDTLATKLESTTAAMSELEEEHGGEEAAFAGFDKINAASVKDRLRELDGEPGIDEERGVLQQWLDLSSEEAALKKQLKAAEADLDAKLLARYTTLREDDIRELVVDDKWLATLDAAVHGELDRISQQLTRRVTALAERYVCPLPALQRDVAELEEKVAQHLQRMGFAWA